MLEPTTINPIPPSSGSSSGNNSNQQTGGTNGENNSNNTQGAGSNSGSTNTSNTTQSSSGATSGSSASSASKTTTGREAEVTAANDRPEISKEEELSYYRDLAERVKNELVMNSNLTMNKSSNAILALFSGQQTQTAAGTQVVQEAYDEF